jgi:hypothetical protein
VHNDDAVGEFVVANINNGLVEHAQQAIVGEKDNGLFFQLPDPALDAFPALPANVWCFCFKSRAA